MVRADGSIVSVLIDMTIVRDALDEPSYYFVQVRDITDRKRAEDALAHQALHDDLTRLPNRLLLVDRLSHSLARADRTDSSVAVLFLDLDRFKLVNDGLGHVVGDQLLIEVAASAVDLDPRVRHRRALRRRRVRRSCAKTSRT